jgi:hypothetical protein
VGEIERGEIERMVWKREAKVETRMWQREGIGLVSHDYY